MGKLSRGKEQLLEKTLQLFRFNPDITGYKKIDPNLDSYLGKTSQPTWLPTDPPVLISQSGPKNKGG